MVFVDTGAWFAWFIQADPHHTSVNRWLANNDEPRLTTDYCVAATLTLLADRNHPQVALEATRTFIQEDLATLHFLTREQSRRAAVVFQSRHAAGWSFVDCTSKFVIDELGIQTAPRLTSTSISSASP